MKAVVQHKNGDPTDPEVLSVDDGIPIPEPAEGQVRVKVACASLNPVDYKLVTGEFPVRKPMKGLGADVSGTVDAVGPGYDGPLAVGDKVYGDCILSNATGALLLYGSFAEHVVVQAASLNAAPANLTDKEAASLPLAGLTALQALVTAGNLREGQKVAILGGSGGVGSLAVQMAKALGAGHVVATGSSEELIKGLGADAVINYREVDVAQEMKGMELDLVFDTVGGLDGWKAAQAGLKKGGAFVTIVGDGGSMASMMGALAWRNLKSLAGGPSYKLVLTDTKVPAVASDMKKLTEMVEKGEVRPIVDDRDFELTTPSLGEMIKAVMTHRTKGSS